MSETTNIARMAELISNKIFKPLGWTVNPPINQDWPCQTDAHKPEGKTNHTHPSDVVFSYDHPYDNSRIYVNTDLKSYGGGTIVKREVVDALQSLAHATDCASRNKAWQARHVDPNVQPSVVGMLFIFNHDNDYHGDFKGLLRELDEKQVKIPPSCRLFVIGPHDVLHLLNLVMDMRLLREAGVLPPAQLCQFVYPHLIRARARAHKSSVASLELLTGPWQIYSFSRIDGAAPKEGIVVYYRGLGVDRDEYKYIFDYLFRYQLIGDDIEIHLRVPHAGADAESTFRQAIKDYAFGIPGNEHVQEVLKQIKYEIPQEVVAQFKAESIGMDLR